MKIAHSQHLINKNNIKLYYIHTKISTNTIATQIRKNEKRNDAMRGMGVVV